jgi:hypothetical protein
MAKRAALVALFLSAVIALWGGITLAAQQSGGTRAVPSGSFAADLNVQPGGDPCGHDPFIWHEDPPPHNVPLQVIVNGTSITINGTAPWVNVSGTMGPAGDFEAQGTGAVGPNPQATVQLVGTWNGTTLAGKYAMGAGQNDLPPCGQPPTHHPAIYTIKPKPGTPTPTPTPPKLYSIIVLKLNDNNLQPLPGWLMQLYSGTGCQGSPLSSHVTGTNGLYDFEGLPPGSYSVAEVNQTGWNPDGPTCRDVTLGAATAGVVATCPIPNEAFPQPGCDSFQSAAKVNITFNGSDQVISAELGGPTLIERKNKPRDINGNGLDEVKTEIVSLQLTGGGVTVRLAPAPASTGLIEEQHNTTSGTLDFPANSFFDVFFQVDVNGLTLHNATPLHVQCKITEIPPYKCLYFPSISDPILLLNSDGVKVGELLHGLHIPIPPNEKIVIFSNRPKGTTTPTPTPSTGTPTVTPTPTRTRTPTPTTTPPTSTPTPTNPPPNGACTKTAQGVTLQNKTWDQWKCIPTPPNTRFNRIDIFVGSAQQDPVLSAVHFVCQTTNQKVVGALKAHKNGVNPGTMFPNDEVWSGTFDPKCVEGVNVYVQPVSPAVHPTILQVAFTDTQTPTATPTHPPEATPTPTPTPRPRNGDANKDGTTNPIDATFVLQFSAGLLQTINPSSDVNGDGMTNPIDGTLILQFSAGLLDHLPV